MSEPIINKNQKRTRLPAFDADYMYLLVDFDWFMVLLVSAVIRQSDEFGFVCQCSIKKHSISWKKCLV